MSRELILPWSSDYEDYLHDESRRIGSAESISFPTSEDEVVEVLREIGARGGTVTVQGARTGIVAGAVPQGGHVMNLSRMSALGELAADEDADYGHVIAQPGALLSNIRDAAAARGLFFPPDPTETSASIGGMIACNASGAMTFHYGATRRWVNAVRLVLSDGSALEVRRSEVRAHGRRFSLRTEEGRLLEGELPAYTVPDVKTAAGYYAADDMDMLDLFVGMEGTLGVVTQVELRLIPKPGAVNGLTVFLPNEEAALKFVRAARGEKVEGLEPIAVRPVAIEFFDSDSLDLLRRMKAESSAFENIPLLKPDYHTAVYIEFHGEDDEDLEEPITQVTDALAALEVSDDDTWYATDERELEPLKAFRHAVPEAVNLLIGERKKDVPELTKLGTDMSAPDDQLEAAIGMYRAGLADSGLESVVFGHIGNNHVHVNILPRDLGDYERGKELYMSWARRIVEMGGSVSAEHGIGKIKAPFLRMMYGDQGIDQMRRLRQLFDPDGVLNPGDLF